jgi:hypothetical protein
MMDINELLERYFEGETSAEDERRLRAFFASDDVPEHLVAYKPLFAYFDEEIIQIHPNEIAKPSERNLRGTKKAVLFILSGVAACFLGLLGLSRLLYPTDPCFCSDNYVVINGRCYTDIHKVRSLAIEALQEVATPADEYFPGTDTDKADRLLIDNQLKELGSIFSEDE